jgi:CheY-like chemotaxis protein
MTDREDFPALDVLLVEDDEGDVLMTREAFEFYELRNPLHVVSDGVQALEFLRLHRPVRRRPAAGDDPARRQPAPAERP